MSSKATPRLITALVGIPLLILLVGWGSGWVFSLVVFVLTGVALCEYFLIAFPGSRGRQAFGVSFGLLVSLSVLVGDPSETGFWLGGILVIVFVTYLFWDGKLEERLVWLGWTLLGIFYVGYLVPHASVVFRLPDGKHWLFFVFLVIMVGDTAAYYVGTYFGKRKLAPQISPGKTIEGGLASVGASVLAGIAGGIFLLPAVSGLEVVLMSFVLSVLGQTGDLFESWIKRVFSVKDSGGWLPGHGGLLDRLDSLVFPVVFTSYFMRLFRP